MLIESKLIDPIRDIDCKTETGSFLQYISIYYYIIYIIYLNSTDH